MQASGALGEECSVLIKASAVLHVHVMSEKSRCRFVRLNQKYRIRIKDVRSGRHVRILILNQGDARYKLIM